MFFEVGGELFVDHAVDETFDVAVAEFCFGLSFELWFWYFDGDDSGASFSGVWSCEFDGGDVVFFDVVVHCSGECCGEAAVVCSVFCGVDVVDEGVDVFLESFVVLECYFDFDGVVCFVDVDGLFVDWAFCLVEVLDECGDASVVLVGGLFVGSLVGEGDAEPFVEEGEFSESLGEDVMVELEVGEYFRVGKEVDGCAGGGCFSDFFDWRCWRSLEVFLVVCFAVSHDSGFKPGGKGVHDADAYAVQASRYFVGFFVEFSTCVEDGEDKFKGAFFFDGVVFYGDASAVVMHSDAAVWVDGDVDAGAVSCKCFINGVVDYFPDEMVESSCAYVSYVHGGAFADCFKPFKDSDMVCSVIVAHGRFF